MTSAKPERVIDCIAEAERSNRVMLSFEIIPPERGGNLRDDIFPVMDALVKYDPPFIDITSHPPASAYKQKGDGSYMKLVEKDRPGTGMMCVAIQHKYGVPVVPHVLCEGFSPEGTEDFLREMWFSGVQNLLALRGDEPREKARGAKKTRYAIDLVRQIEAEKRGIFVKEYLTPPKNPDFCIGAAGYPERHFEAPNMKVDITRLKEKVEAGSSYVVLQMCYANKRLFNFLGMCKEEGISVPIFSGLKILDRKSQLSLVPKRFHCEIPFELSDKVEKEGDKEKVMRIGVEHAAGQIEEQIEHGIRAIHLYVMLNPVPVQMLMEELEKRKIAVN